MILRRFMKHVNEQNWFAVGLDVIVVIVGIFLGLQVQEWNEGREQRVEEKDYIARLATELTETIQFNDAVIIELDTSHQKLPLAMNMIDSGNLNNNTMEEFEEYFSATTYIPHPILQSSAITEMIATGKVGLIRSAFIKNQIIRYNNAIINQQNNINGQFSEFLSVRNDINEQVRLAPDYWLSKRVLDTPEDITKNRVLFGKISFINEFQTKQLEQISEFHQHTKELEALLLSHLETIQ